MGSPRCRWCVRQASTRREKLFRIGEAHVTRGWLVRRATGCGTFTDGADLHCKTRSWTWRSPLEGMYELPRQGKSHELQKRVASFLGTDAVDRERIRETIRRFYQARSEIVHSGSGEALPFRKEAAFVAGFSLARMSLFKLLRKGPPDDWQSLGVTTAANGRFRDGLHIAEGKPFAHDHMSSEA